MFAKRNSLTLALIWIVILLVGALWYVKDARTLARLQEDHQSRQVKLDQSRADVKRLTEVETLHEEIHEKWSKGAKKIVSADEPSFTLSYINWIMSTNDLDIYYDFELNAKDTTDQHTEFHYTLTGEGMYDDINKLIWLLTYEPILYKINSMQLKKVGLESELLKFTLKMGGFSVASETRATEELSDYTPVSNQVAYNPTSDIFRITASPRALVATKVANVLPKKRPGEVDVEKASLKAVTANSIFIAEQGARVVELRVGDAVYLGRLAAINQQANSAEFAITKFGRTERITLGISARN